jgi:hypothetical protein
MHNYSKGNCVILKEGSMIRGLPSLARLALGPSGLWSTSFVFSFRHKRIATVEKIDTRMQMQYLIDGFNLIDYTTTPNNHGVHG